MARTPDEAVAWAKAHPRKTVGAPGPSWAGWCAALVFWAGGFERSFSSAMAAGDASGYLNPNWRQAKKGDIHYWAGVGGDGHVAIDIGGDGNDRLLLMASSSVTDSFGLAIGAVWMSQYNRLGIPYRGFTNRWGNETLAGSIAVGPTAPPSSGTITTQEEDDMPRIYSSSDVKNPDGSNRDQYLINNNGAVHITSGEHLSALRAAIAGTGTFRQLKIFEAYVAKLKNYPTKLIGI